MRVLFNKFDENQDGFIDLDEFTGNISHIAVKTEENLLKFE